LDTVFPAFATLASCVGRSENMEDKAMTKVKDLTPASKQVNVLVKVVSLSEEREITSKFGEARKLVEATVGDETGTVLLTLWNDQIGSVHKDETLLIDNGYVTLVRGHIRLNVGKYGTMAKSEQMIENVNTALDVSAVEYEREPRYRSGGYSGERRERSGGGDRQVQFGAFSRNRRGGGGGGGRAAQARGAPPGPARVTLHRRPSPGAPRYFFSSPSPGCDLA